MVACWLALGMAAAGVPVRIRLCPGAGAGYGNVSVAGWRCVGASIGVVKDGVSRDGSPGDFEGIRLEGIDVDSCGDFDYPRFL